MRGFLPPLIGVLLLMPGAIRAATLVEMSAVRLVIDRPRQRGLIERAGRQTWFDLNGGSVYHLDGDGPAQRAHAR